MYVSVTAEHIRNGLRTHSPARLTRCPVALALKDAGCYSVMVAGSESELCNDRWGQGRYIRFPNGPMLRDWIRRYDDGQAVEPITIELGYTAEIAGAQ